MVPPSDKLMPNFPKNTTTTKRQQQRCEERTNRAAASQVPFVDEVLMRVIPPGRMTSRPLPRNQGLWVKTTTAPCSDAETASDHSMKTKLNPQLTALMLPQTNGFFRLSGKQATSRIMDMQRKLHLLGVQRNLIGHLPSSSGNPK